MLDTIIRGGWVIDGTGTERQRADIGIADGRVTDIGIDLDDARRTIDADGRIVTPGFIDVHTHLDAQPFWDGTLSPSPLHGITSVIGGNCGFTIAPLTDDPADGEYLMRMLARVEGMPLESLQEGVPWNWRTTAEYLDAVEPHLAVNAGYKVGHSALRRVVMGEACTEREATAVELDAMCALLRDGLRAGALGFSSSWSRTHNDADGHMVPSRYASRDELLALSAVVGEFPGTGLEFLPMAGAHEDWAIELMTDMSLAAGGRQLNWNVLTVSAANIDDARHRLRGGTHAAERGGKVVALTVPATFGLRMSFASGFILDALPGWEEAMLLPLEDKKALLADPGQRRRLAESARQDSPFRGIANWDTQIIFDTLAPENDGFAGRTVGDVAAEMGLDPFDALVEISLADGLRTSFGRDDPEQTRADWEARLEIWRDDRAVIGASDAGAHLDMFGTFNFATRLIEGAVRDHGLMPLEEAVAMLTSSQADLYGMVDRGRIAVGGHADLVILDEDTIGSDPLSLRADLPGGATRLYAGATGIDEVLCGGVTVVADGEFTDDRPGRVLRSGTDTR